MNDVTSLVRRSLDERSGDLPSAPPPWSRISAGLSAVRRRRRRRQAGIVGAVAALAVVGALAGGVVPTSLRQGAPATPDGGAVRSGAVFGNRTVGSLARDRAFLADLRREVVAAGLDVGEGTPQVFRPEDVLVPFAGDVGDLRLALLEVAVGGGDGVRERFVWLSASQGAPAADLARHPYEIDDAGPVASLWLPTPTGNGARDGVGALVVLSAARERTALRVAGLPELTDKGRFAWAIQDVPPSSPGHWEAAVPWQFQDVSAGWWAFPDSPTWSELELPYVDDSGSGFASDRALHGGAPARGPAVALALAKAQANARVRVASSLRTLLWTGTVGDRIRSVVAVTVPSGAHVITVGTAGPGAEPGTFSAPFIRPAGPLEDVCLAMFSDGGNGADPGLFVLGPVGAVRAVVGGQSPGTPLTDEVATVPVQAPDGTTVDFVDAAGKTLCTTTVNGTSDRFEPHG